MYYFRLLLKTVWYFLQNSLTVDSGLLGSDFLCFCFGCFANCGKCFSPLDIMCTRRGGGNVDVSMGVGVELVSWVVQVLCVWVVC